MMKFANTGISTSRCDADKVARDFNGGRLPKYAELDKFKMEDNYSGTFWGKEWAAKGVLIEKGKDLVDKGSSVLIPYGDIEKANKALIESGKAGIVGVKGVLFLIDPEACTLKNGLDVLENPKITVVENAVLEMGGKGMADPETKIAIHAAEMVLDSLPVSQIRWNYIGDGIWPLVRGDKYLLGNYGRLYVVSYGRPSYRFRVLSVTEDKKD
ncbi:MAG: hypothetical protein NTX79_03560 [Candidatus Micrarchaeota archaeon]|nr:hypothetical protein [Candidatus Micrarchaeota archaeon]